MGAAGALNAAASAPAAAPAAGEAEEEEKVVVATGRVAAGRVVSAEERRCDGSTAERGAAVAGGGMPGTRAPAPPKACEPEPPAILRGGLNFLRGPPRPEPWRLNGRRSIV